MLSFDSSLSNALKPGDTTAFWVLKLYYNDDSSASNFIGVSDIHRIDGADVYHGLVSSWGQYQQSLDFFNFTTSTGNMTVKLINTERSLIKDQVSYEDDHSTTGKIAEDIGASESSSIALGDATNFNVGDYIKINDEVMLITALSGGNMDVTRHVLQIGTPPATTHSNRDVIYHYTDNRFSDLLRTFNFENRKWELFLNTSQAGTYDTAARIIGTGIISGDISYDDRFVDLILLDLSSKKHKKLPNSSVTSASYANAPENNIGKPIPLFYGDCHDKTDIGTIPTSGANFDRHFTKGKFPAIITNKWDETNARTEALVDSVAVHTLDTENVYMAIGDNYGACNSSNVTESEANFKISALGMDWRVYVPVQKHSTYSGGTNYANMIDGSFSGTGYLLSQTGAGATSVGFRIGKLPNLGVLTAVSLLIDFGNFTGEAPNINFKASPAAGAGAAITDTITWDGGDQTLTVTGFFSTGEKTAWNVEREFFLTIDNTNDDPASNMQVYINEVGLEYQVEPSQTFSKDILEKYEAGSRFIGIDEKFPETQDVYETVYKTRTKTILIPTTVDYLYFSGKGRKYGAWIDDIDGGTDNRTSHNGGEPDPNYTEGAAIINPVYIIEDILRTELGLDVDTDGSDIDLETFDRSGNAQTDDTKGDIAFTFNDAIADIEFAFSQYKFISSKDLIDRICKQICSWVWISGDGKFKIRTLLRPTDTWAEDKTVDYNDIALKRIYKTPLNNVRNDITVNYNYDYNQEQNLSLVNTTDSTSQGTTFSGNHQVLKLEIDADGVLDSTTATQLADAYKSILKDRKIALEFDCLRPHYNDLEIGDIIKFSNWDVNIQLYGVAMGPEYFIVEDISKSVNGCSIKAIKVS